MNVWDLLLVILPEWFLVLFSFGALLPMIHIYFNIHPVVLNRVEYIMLMTCVLVIGLFYLMIWIDNHQYGIEDLTRHRAVSRLIWFWLIFVSYYISNRLIHRGDPS
jgi:hypothetical protein